MGSAKAHNHWPTVLQVLFLGALASVLLFYRLGDRYLWQDEAQTAVLADRMLRFGRPLAYDGVNLITIDHFVEEDAGTLSQRTGNPKVAVEYYVHRGDFKPDTTWTWHPWGQFLIDAISLKILGRNTLAARLPFALAGLLSVLLMYRFVRVDLGSPFIASLSTLFLVFNAYWILHSRQCRYYSLSSLFLLLTIMTYHRWQRGSRWGALAFIAAAWCWFQVDYGTIWPVLLVLFCDAFIVQRHQVWRPILVGATLIASLLPFIYYFELWHRHSIPARPWDDRFFRNLFNMNEYVVPLLVLIAAIVLLSWQSSTLDLTERRLIRIVCAIMVAFIFWVPLAAPTSFLRYLVIVAPLGCLLTAWVLVRGLGSRRWLVWIGAVVFILTPWASWLLPAPSWYKAGGVLRPELPVLWKQVFVGQPDPNRSVIEWLKKTAVPSDEVLINYEDIPLMFYLPNPIRGGIAAFRVSDDSKTPPNFLVLRHSVPYVQWPAYMHEIGRYQWSEVPLQAPDLSWGNNPDPSATLPNFSTGTMIYVARRTSNSNH